MSKNLLVKLRQSAFQAQSGSCYYCGSQMWQSHSKLFARKYKLTKKQARNLFCTAEHLIAKCDGGTDSASNIAAACINCNLKRHQTKHPLSPRGYKKFVQEKLKVGIWLTFGAEQIALLTSAT